ncbi:MAG: Toxin ToxN, type III toxin-antitoxin system [Bacteriophage sp.]|uniref:Type III toxin-antitoxin system ToxN/AbiQ family toxin n=3 Tax=Clostridium perfringens TaxID=1502 RepID=A0AAW9KM02_CLOPF|nr:type III toxin-antitoxin system ToxN/AbiQ family toxin [Clostridium perfringens]MDZ4949151.1 type III toxin-antitoxin system ToxN/AbiQ family toxin [Clostridium perfringens]MDZ7542195.1 type III toxin-antitoxin system ToxN/AbiQ family toxin [Clostridium perfringens]UVX36139.1 MAG: Toxin ToxN, type III toxin-antitoxin system [Bacteriophage sp.]
MRLNKISYSAFLFLEGESMKWCTIEKEFLDKLRNYESRIPNTDYGQEKFKPFFGVLFEVGDLCYVSQVSHKKSRHYNMTDNKDFIKLYNGNRLLAVVNLNYMFPVHKSKLINVEYKNISDFRTFENDIEKGKYISLLKKEIREIKNKNVSQKAQDLYKFKYDYPNHFVSLRCLDFKDLEKKCFEIL